MKTLSEHDDVDAVWYFGDAPLSKDIEKGQHIQLSVLGAIMERAQIGTKFR